MFVSDDLIFLHMQKAAGTEIIELLSYNFYGKKHGKHLPIDFDPGNRLVVGSVRNPWDWYVSLWSFGCAGSGGLRKRLAGSRMATSKRVLGRGYRDRSRLMDFTRWGDIFGNLTAQLGRDPDFWSNLYSDPQDPVLFRKWLKTVLSADGRRLLGFDYATKPLATFAGFCTYRFLFIFTAKQVWIDQSTQIRSFQDVENFYRENCIVSMFVKTENLRADMQKVLAKVGKPEVDVENLQVAQKNSSKRLPTNIYYDQETIRLVEEADAFIISEFDYKPPRIDL